MSLPYYKPSYQWEGAVCLLSCRPGSKVWGVRNYNAMQYKNLVQLMEAWQRSEPYTRFKIGNTSEIGKPVDQWVN